VKAEKIKTVRSCDHLFSLRLWDDYGWTFSGPTPERATVRRIHEPRGDGKVECGVVPRRGTEVQRADHCFYFEILCWSRAPQLIDIWNVRSVSAAILASARRLFTVFFFAHFSISLFCFVYYFIEKRRGRAEVWEYSAKCSTWIYTTMQSYDVENVSPRNRASPWRFSFAGVQRLLRELVFSTGAL